ncbi:aspartyl protease family protein [Geojedonia litorea]|uniref:Aspartyl protease family protein n=1 Tax=Geojedonia litorea TaxID=1268269 RepID=A0ABV9N7K7_9FLAO
MTNKNLLIFLLISITFNVIGYSQSKFSLPRANSDKIRFQLIDNLIIIPVEINGVELSFLVDSGVSKPILFNITNTDSLQINQIETIYLRGLGGGEPIEAVKSRKNFFKIGKAININQDIYVVFDDLINFTPRLGVPVHGIIGFDLFKDFVVEINYKSKYLKLHRPETYKYKDCKKCEAFNLSFYNNKPYMEGEVTLDSSKIPVKLLIDTGSSDALWLFEDDNLGLSTHHNKYFVDFLGKGLSGNVYGKRSRVSSFNLKSFEFKKVNVAFPDSTSISYARKHQERNGSIAGEILKRFNIIMDYRSARITLKKNGNFRNAFHYNMSGIVLEQDGVRVVREKHSNKSYDNFGRSNEDNTVINLVETFRYNLKPAYRIVELRKGSPAELSGLMLDDVIISINNKEVHTLSLQEVNHFFRAGEGKRLKIRIERDFIPYTFQFTLEDPLK